MRYFDEGFLWAFISLQDQMMIMLWVCYLWYEYLWHEHGNEHEHWNGNGVTTPVAIKICSHYRRDGPCITEMRWQLGWWLRYSLTTLEMTQCITKWYNMYMFMADDMKEMILYMFICLRRMIWRKWCYISLYIYGGWYERDDVIYVYVWMIWRRWYYISMHGIWLYDDKICFMWAFTRRICMPIYKRCNCV